jgi:hypothetical protein
MAIDDQKHTALQPQLVTHPGLKILGGPSVNVPEPHL